MTRILDGTGGWTRDMDDYLIPGAPRVATIYGPGSQDPPLTPPGTPKDWDVWEQGAGHSLAPLAKWLEELPPEVTHLVDDREKVHVWNTMESASMLMFIRRHAPPGVKIGMYGMIPGREEYDYLKSLVDFYTYGLYMGPNWGSKQAYISRFDTVHPLIPFVSPLVQQRQVTGEPKKYPRSMLWYEYEEAVAVYRQFDTVIAWAGPEGKPTYLEPEQAAAFAARIEGATP